MREGECGEWRCGGESGGVVSGGVEVRVGEWRCGSESGGVW